MKVADRADARAGAEHRVDLRAAAVAGAARPAQGVTDVSANGRRDRVASAPARPLSPGGAGRPRSCVGSSTFRRVLPISVGRIEETPTTWMANAAPPDRQGTPAGVHGRPTRASARTGAPDMNTRSAQAAPASRSRIGLHWGLALLGTALAALPLIDRVGPLQVLACAGVAGLSIFLAWREGRRPAADTDGRPSSADGPSAREAALAGLLAEVLPVWLDHVTTVRQQTESAVTQLAVSFSSIMGSSRPQASRAPAGATMAMPATSDCSRSASSNCSRSSPRWPGSWTARRCSSTASTSCRPPPSS